MQKIAIFFIAFIILKVSLVTRGLPHPGPQDAPKIQEMVVLKKEEFDVMRQRNVQGIQKTEEKNYMSITPEMLQKDSYVCAKCGKSLGKEPYSYKDDLCFTVGEDDCL
ncbi:uncharacterized protein LOC126843364 isoform X2 [Adelges cooleyi]|uniref:uncharacterized protein LOC126843364 isoform X2 n=1 Tax=Adelges cooleyi TaxID=133065 RepID=UPI0021807D0D|nr:uncharacterized protein LOC126843364 isoform X2 [Adelges cooleyi]